MEAYQQPPRFVRPPQQPMPPAADPQYQYHHQYQTQPPRGPPMQPPFGYANQFQFQRHQSHSSPSPPPPWPHPDPSAFHPPPSVPYQAGLHFPTPPSAPHMPPHQIHHPYPQASNQDWANSYWSHHQGWDYSAHNNVEDWGAKAREWANSRAAMQQQQQPQTQYSQSNTSEEHNNRFGQTLEPHYPDNQSLQTSSYQQFLVSAAPPQPLPSIYYQEKFSTASVPSSYGPDGQPLYHVMDGNASGFPPQGSLTTTPSIHLQEVPSSYSPASGTRDSADPVLSSNPLAVPFSSGLDVQHHAHHSLPATGRSTSAEDSFVYGSRGFDASADLSDRPLDFAPRFNGNHDQMQSTYTTHSESMGVSRGVEPVAAIPSMNSWTSPVAAGVAYPPISSVPVTATQHDPSMAIPSPAFGHVAPPFARFQAPGLQQAVPSNGASFGLGTGAPLHSVAAFSGDIYGSVPERPKKAPVPNWLKEELFKSSALPKASINNSKELQLVEDDSADKSFGKGDQADSKSIDSSKSTEDEDDEDYVEATRTAAINQEIKRVLTEVLLKVTDELFDEIATKVINEDDTVAEADPGPSNFNALQPTSVSNSRAVARVVVHNKDLGAEPFDGGEKSSSSSPENLLGLANYASDDDEDGELQSSSISHAGKNAVVQPSGSTKYTETKGGADDIANSEVRHDRNGGTENNLGMNLEQFKISNANAVRSRDDRAGLEHDSLYSSVVTRDAANSLKLENKDARNSRIDTSPVEEDSSVFDDKVGKGSLTHDSHSKDIKMRTEKNDKYENRSFSSRDIVRREGEKREEYREMTVAARKEKVKEHDARTRGTPVASERGRKPDHPDVLEGRKDKDRSHRVSTKEESGRKKESKKAGDRSSHKQGSESSKHKRRRSSSVSSRGRISKDSSGPHANDSYDEVSNDSKSKLNSRKRDLSPSPDRSRRRQVSRSPRSKHYQRRHSPYSSHEASRRRRSRSGSPVRRQR